MGLKEISLLLGIIASVFLGIVYIWKKGVKPVVRFFQGIDEIRENQKLIEINRKRIGYVNSKLNALMELDQTPLFVCDEQGLCVFANEALMTLFGARGNEMLGYGWTNFIIPEYREQAQVTWERGMKNDSRTIIAEYPIIHGLTGERIELRYHAIISREEHNAIVSVGKVKNKKHDKFN